MKQVWKLCVYLIVLLSFFVFVDQTIGGDILKINSEEPQIKTTNITLNDHEQEHPSQLEQNMEITDTSHIFDFEDSDLDTEHSLKVNKRGSFLLEWLKEMKTFIPSNQFVFDLQSKSDEYFYYEVDDNNPHILLGYFCTDDTEGNIHVTINNPESKRIYNKHGCEGVYNNRKNQDEIDDIKASHRIKGTYTIIFSNHRWHDTIRVSLLVGNDSKKNNAVDKKNVDNITSKIENIDNILSVIYTENQYIWSLTKANLNNIFYADNKLVLYTVTQIITIIAASIIQIIYLKNILTQK